MSISDVAAVLQAILWEVGTRQMEYGHFKNALLFSKKHSTPDQSGSCLMENNMEDTAEEKNSTASDHTWEA